MKQSKWLFRITTALLSGSLLLTTISFPAMANDTSVSASSGTETVIDETETTTSTESTAETDNSTASSETESEIKAVSAYHTITSFAPLPDEYKEFYLSYYDKPSEAELIAELPTSLTVYLDSSSDPQELPVTWESVGDFDSTSFCYYEFDPVWDTDVYTLTDNVETPYIGVQLATSEAVNLAANNQSSSNESIIYNYLINEMGLSISGACGVLANIQAESGFNPNLYGDSGSSYGICQWRDGSDVKRFTALKNYSADWDTLEGQLDYLHYELKTDYPSLLKKLKSADNNADGAYQAAYDWCYDFERPANTKNMAISRGNLARNSYWPKYSSSQTDKEPITIANATVPNPMTQGSPFNIAGIVSSKSIITSITIGVYDINGTLKIGKTVTPNTTSYDLRNDNTSIKFSALSAGGYNYRVVAVTNGNQVTLINNPFIVLSTNRTIADGIYQITANQNTEYTLSIDHNRNTSGTNVLLWEKANIPHRRFKFTYQNNGYYTIQNIGSGLYLSITNQSSVSGANVEQSASASLWQVLTDGAGSYYLIPKNANNCCLNLYSNTVGNGQNIDIETYNSSASQRWNLVSPPSAPSITGQTIPQNMTQGSSFDIQGTISAGEKLTSVTVGVYDTSGKLMVGKTVSPNTSSYNLKDVDTSIKFSSLPVGGYRYKVTASTASGNHTFVNQIFMVLSTGRTIADGSYLINSAQNQGYSLSVDHNRNISGTNILLWQRGNIPHRRFQFIYQSNGYYTIKNVGSGLYLSVTGQSSASGANVEQSSTATLWQVLPDNKGGYYIVPNCSATSCLDLYSGIPANGKNIETWKYNLLGSQRWYLTGSSSNSSSKPTLSGQTIPGNIRQGSSFDIRGIISSNEKLTAVTVGVYDTNGNMKIGKTVSPNAVSYNLKSIDTSIKFSALSPGGYRYKITVSTVSGNYTLANHIFMVMSTGRPITDGIYMIASVNNQNYSLSVDHNRNTSGTNILLWQRASIPHRKFQFIYQSNGYYKIKNIGSGLYLSVTNHSSASGANVEQSSSATLWQVLPDGSGSYYIVPNCSSTSCLDLYSGVPKNGQNIETWKYNLLGSQRWLLIK